MMQTNLQNKNSAIAKRICDNQQKAQSVTHLIIDVDGTLTDGKIYMGDNGELFKSFNIKDGYGISEILPAAKITPVILTGRESKILFNRCRELHIKKIYSGIRNKLELLKEFVKSENTDFHALAYIGDDLNDAAAMTVCGLRACPSDAADEIKEICDFICEHAGGYGAVRDFIDFIAAARRGS